MTGTHGTLTLALSVLSFGAACRAPGEEPAATQTAATETTATEERMAESNITELIREDVEDGAGDTAAAGRSVTVHYTGWLYDAARDDRKGAKFDSSRDRNDPFTFRLGSGQVIRGWDEGVAGMRVGGQRTLTIPPAYGYGSDGVPGAIPPNATLVFDVELLDVR